MKYYIAYGSNLSVSQMAYRCPDAKIVGRAILHDWKLVFRIHATIEPEIGSTVPVLVWKISDSDEQRLDRYEGFPKYYVKETLPVNVTGLRSGKQKELNAMVYIMAKGRPIIPPNMEYYGIIMEGYKRFGFDTSILKDAFSDAFLGIPTEPEPEPEYGHKYPAGF